MPGFAENMDFGKEIIGQEKISIHSESIASEKHPESNEDAFFELSDKRIAGVLDGMGGHADGREAAQTALESLKNRFDKMPTNLSLDEQTKFISDTILEAQKSLRDKCRAQDSNMGTTLALASIWKDKNGERKLIAANVGDSRVYLYRAGKLTQITEDDSVLKGIQNPSERKRYNELLNNITNLTELDSTDLKYARTYFKMRHRIDQYLGMKEDDKNRKDITPSILVPNIIPIDLRTGDRIIICTDGISDNLTDREMEGIIKTNQNGNDLVGKLVSESQTRSKSEHLRAKRDDMTVVAMEVN